PHRVDDAVKLQQHTVAGGLDEAAMVLGDSGIDEFDPVGLEACKRPGLVDLHEPAVTDPVGGDHRSEPAFGSWRNHWPSYTAELRKPARPPQAVHAGRPPCRLSHLGAAYPIASHCRASGRKKIATLMRKPTFQRIERSRGRLPI